MSDASRPVSSLSERSLIFLIAMVQFINVLDFVMIMPMGPDFAEALAIPNPHLGWIGGSYTAAAAISGWIASFFLDRFDRKSALLLALMGLIVGTLSGGFAIGFSSLLVARIVAGAFGGPASALAISMVSDVVPPQRRGKAIGSVMLAFSVASILGVPIGLEVARWGGWRAPFFALSGLGCLVWVAAWIKLPKFRGHMQESWKVTKESPGSLWRSSWQEMRHLVADPNVRRSWIASSLLMISSFLIIPNFSAYIQFNGNYPREKLGILYLVGGGLTFMTMRWAGRWVDRVGAFRVMMVSGLFWSVNLVLGYFTGRPLIPVMAVFVGFMLPNSIRNVAIQTLVTRVPPPEYRARFQSLHSAIQHLACALGSFLGAMILTEASDGRLMGTGILVAISLVFAWIPLFLIFEMEKQMRIVAHSVVSKMNSSPMPSD